MLDDPIPLAPCPENNGGMEKLHFVTKIDAPAAVVWNAMLGDETYREWTNEFNPGSYFEGGWEQGDIIRFLGPDENGEIGGMLGRIVANIPNEFVSIEYYGLVANGVDDTTSEAVKELVGTHESYTLSEAGGVTTVEIELDIEDAYVEMFNEMWPRALAKLKEIVER